MLQIRHVWHTHGGATQLEGVVGTVGVPPAPRVDTDMVLHRVQCLRVEPARCEVQLASCACVCGDPCGEPWAELPTIKLNSNRVLDATIAKFHATMP